MEQELECLYEAMGREEFNLCIFNTIKTFKYGVSHAINRLELLFIRPEDSGRWAVMWQVKLDLKAP